MTLTEGKPQEADTTNESKPPAKQEKKPMKRFTFDVPASLHRRVKVDCADRDVQMADLIREFLEKAFPA